MMTTICQAIAMQLLVHFWYDGLPRTVEPHLHGTSTVGKSLLRGYQVAGFSRHADRGWRLFEVAKMAQIVILDEPFVIRADYRRRDKAFRTVHCSVERRCAPTRRRF